MIGAVLTKKHKQAIFDRLRESMQGLSRAELVKKMKQAGHPISVNTLSAYSSGIAAPAAETLIGLQKVLGISIDWLLTGEHLDHPDISKFEEIIQDAKAVRSADSREQDPDVSKILDIILSMPSDSRKKVIEFLELTTMRSKR